MKKYERMNVVKYASNERTCKDLEAKGYKEVVEKNNDVNEDAVLKAEEKAKAEALTKEKAAEAKAKAAAEKKAKAEEAKAKAVAEEKAKAEVLAKEKDANAATVTNT